MNDVIALNSDAGTTSFVGRRTELAAVRHLLIEGHQHVLAVVGPGGVGKSRLVAEAVRIISDRFQCVLHLDFAQAFDPARVFAPLFSGEHRDDVDLLFMDNADAGFYQIWSFVNDVVEANPGLRVVVTSREPMRIRGEKVLHLGPLPVPEAEIGAELDDLRRNPSVSLFTQRARAVDPGFELTEQTGPMVAEICVSHGGLPLAIELAATQLGMFGIVSPLSSEAGPDDRSSAIPRSIADKQDFKENLEPLSSVLTNREYEVAHLVAEGLTNHMIGRRLGISDHTVANHMRSVMRKLNCPSRIHVARRIL